VLCPHLAVAVDEVCTLSAGQDFALLLGKELIAVGALVQVVFFLLKQELEFFHEKSAHDLVLALFEDVQSVQADLFGHLSDDIRIYARHVHLHAADFFDVLSNKIKAFTN
jgi:hypothetical protein